MRLRDQDILDTLTAKIRLCTFAQFRRAWFPAASERTADKVLKRLIRAGYIKRFRLNAHPVFSVSGPVHRWRPGDPVPDFEKVAWQLQKRWTKTDVPTIVYVASPFTANLFGTFAGRPPEVLSASHDLGLSEVYFHYREHRPHEAARWRNELSLEKRRHGHGIKDPDAFIFGPNRIVERVVEHGGRYDAKRVASFHWFCREREYAHELW